MPRIAVAIFVVVAVSVSIGINIALYPAVFEVAGSTHESLVSDGTTDVPEAEETEGPVAVNNLPALPDDLAKWNPPAVRKVEPTVTEAVPYVVANSEYADRYENYAGSTSSESASRPATETYTDTAGESEEAVASSPESPEAESAYQHYEVEPYQPYLEDRGQEVEDVGQKTEVSEEEKAPVETSSEIDRIWDRPICGDTTSSQQNLAWQKAEEQRTEVQSSVNTQPVEYQATPYVASGNERPRPGAWPATVADSFRYGQGVVRQMAPSESETNVTTTTTESSVPENSVSSVRKPTRQVDPDLVFEETGDWEASVPMVALRDNGMSRESQPQASYDATFPAEVELISSQIKRLPEVTGSDILPGALPPSRPIDYPVTR